MIYKPIWPKKNDKNTVAHVSKPSPNCSFMALG